MRIYLAQPGLTASEMVTVDNHKRIEMAGHQAQTNGPGEGIEPGQEPRGIHLLWMGSQVGCSHILALSQV